MAIFLDHATKSLDDISDPHTVSHTVGTEYGNRLLVVVVVQNSAHSVTGVTYNSVAMTQAATQQNSDATGRVSLYYLVNPSTGANTVSVDQSAGGTCTVYASSWYGVSQTSPLDDTGVTAATSSAVSTTVTPTTNGQLIIDGLHTKASSNSVVPVTQNALTPDTIWNQGFDEGAWNNGSSFKVQTTAAETTMTWTTSASAIYAHVVATFKSADPTSSIVSINSTPTSATASSVGPALVAHTVNAGTNTLLVATVGYNNATTTGTAATFNGDAMTLAKRHVGADYTVEIWYRANPDVATGNVSVTLSATARWIVSAVALNGMDLNDIVDATAGSEGTGGPFTGSITTVDPYTAIVVATYQDSTTDVWPTGGQFHLVNQLASVDEGNMGVFLNRAETGAHTISWAVGAGNYSQALASFNAATVGGASGTLMPFFRP